MAAAEVAQVRVNTNEPTDDLFVDEEIQSLIDAGSVDSASAAVWKAKAAVYADLADTTEAGASHKYGDLFNRALQMQAMYEGLVAAAVETLPTGPKVRLIERS